VAEIAFVGRAPGIYNLYLGGGHQGQRLAKLYREAVGEEEILASLTPLIRKEYALDCREGEHFGDWVIRAGYVAETHDSIETYNDWWENTGQKRFDYECTYEGIMLCVFFLTKIIGKGA
jgi:sulfite reductase beta subunit-like hemoprotein